MSHDEEKLRGILAKLKELEVPPPLDSYVKVVIAETEQDLAAKAMGPRRGRSIFELFGGATRMYPELESAEDVRFWLSRLEYAVGRLPDYFPWRFNLQSESVSPISDTADVVRGEVIRIWRGGSWQVRLIRQPLSDSSFDPFIVPVLDTLSPEGWWLIDRKDCVTPILDEGEVHFFTGRSGEFGFLKVAPGNAELGSCLNPIVPAFNRDVQLLAVAGNPKPSFAPALISMIDNALARAPDLTVAEAALSEIWLSPAKEMAEHFESGHFRFAASTGHAESLLWVAESANG